MSLSTAPSRPAERVTGRARLPMSLTHRLAHGTVGLGVLAGALLGAATWDTGLLPVVLFVLLPDSAFLLALLPSRGAAPDRGQLPRHVVPVYNLLHHPAGPLALLAVAGADLVDRFWLVAGLAWFAHIAVDRAAGYGLRTREGWQRG